MRHVTWLLALSLTIALHVASTAQDIQQTGGSEYLAADCGCGEACDCCGPTTEFRASVLVITRDELENITFITQPDGSDALNMSQFDFEFNSGWEASAIRHGNCCRSVEVRGMALLDTGDTFSVGPFDAGTVEIGTTPPTQLNMLDGWGIIGDYNAELHSGELNVRQHLQALTLIGGFRFIDFQEQFLADIQAGPETLIEWDTDTHNRLYGGQLGIEFDSYVDDCCRFRLRAFGKSGLYYNEADQEVSFEQVSTDTAFAAFIFNTGDASDGDLAFVSEAGVYLSMEMGCGWAATLGYQLLLLDQVAIAANQIPPTGPAVPGPVIEAEVDTDGDALYHGASIGMERRW